MSDLTLAHIAYPVTALGPGKRVALWVSGCPFRCRGCLTPSLLSPAAGRPISIHRLTKRLLALPVDVDGLTLTGGEPFAQAPALRELLEGLSDTRPDWNVLAFSGYTLEQLRGGDAAQRALLDAVDILVDGPYVANQPGYHPLAASANQRVHFLTKRGYRLANVIDALPMNAANIGVHPEAGDWLIGILDTNARKTLHDNLALAPRNVNVDGLSSPRKRRL